MTANVDFMRLLEQDYRRASGLRSRARYKIFYGQVFPAPILTFGLNPAGDPEGMSEDGTRQKDGSPASSSASYFEGMENDVLDCEWRENTGLRKLLLPLVAADRERFRREIINTNVAFRRSGAVRHIDLAAAAREAVPFIDRIMERVSPRLIVLAGVGIDRFLILYALDSRPLCETIKASGINNVVFAATAARLRSTGHEAVVVQVAHASQFAWTYERYGVSSKIAKLIGSPGGYGDGTKHGVQSPPGSIPAAQSTNASGHQAPKLRAAPTTRIGNPTLAELESRWNDLGIAPQFHRVHHFASPKFSGKREPLKGFINHCEPRGIRDENAQTLARALDVARRVEGGRDFEAALEEAWITFPVVRR